MHFCQKLVKDTFLYHVESKKNKMRQQIRQLQMHPSVQNNFTTEGGSKTTNAAYRVEEKLSWRKFNFKINNSTVWDDANLLVSRYVLY